MKKLVLPRRINMLVFGVKKRAPQLFLAGGLATGGACVVVGIIQTLKASKKIDQMHNDISEIEEAVGKQYYEHDEETGEVSSELSVYTEEDAKNDSVIVYRNFILDMGKLYAPVVGLGVTSVLMILKSYGIMSARYIATAAALTSVEKAFGDYRQRVRDRYGNETENDIFHGVRRITLEGTKADENGKEKKFKEEMDVVEVDSEDFYTRLLMPGNPHYEDNIDYMAAVLNAQQSLANDRLRARGWLTLNEARRLVGLDEDATGMVVGWIYNEDNEDGDNKIEFHVKRVNVLGKDGSSVTPAYSISFNVDGNIYTRLAENY